MKAVFLITVALLALARPAPAQIDLTWDNCVLADAFEPAPSVNKNFDCTTLQIYDLIGTFKTPVDVPNFFAIDIYLDIYWVDEVGGLRRENLRPFWDFYGCNAPAPFMSITKPRCARFATPWRGFDFACDIEFCTVAYAPDFLGQPGHGRFILSTSRPSDFPYPLSAGSNYYAFHLTWETGNAPSCHGCGDRMVVIWSHTTLYGNNQEVVLLGRTDKTTANYASINGGFLDRPVPIANTTWGQIKAQYR